VKQIEIKIKYDEMGLPRFTVQMRLKDEDDTNAQEILVGVLKSIKVNMETLWKMGLDSGAVSKQFEMFPPYKALGIN